MKRMLLTLFISSIAALAVDVSGNWKATADGPNGALERTFALKVDGTKLTGETVSAFTGKSTIEDGKIDGDNVTFTIKAKIQDNDVILSYKGKVISKDEIKLTSQIGDSGQSIEWLAKRTN